MLQRYEKYSCLLHHLKGGSILILFVPLCKISMKKTEDKIYAVNVNIGQG
jgi:hypothetical protein